MPSLTQWVNRIFRWGDLRWVKPGQYQRGTGLVSARNWKWLAVALTVIVCVGCNAVSFDNPGNGRTRVAELVLEGLLGTPGADQESVRLPTEFASLSDSGEIVITRWNGSLDVVFFTRRGVVDDWEGYVYAADCRLTEDPLGGVLLEVHNLGSCWYLARAH